MRKKVSPDILEKWLKAWSLSRELPLPVKHGSGFKINVGDKKQKVRYIFSEPDEDFFRLVELINEPCIFLKVCVPFVDFKNKISQKWQVQPQGYMMSCFHPMNIPDISLSDNYKLEYDNYNSTFVVRIITQDNEPVSIGRVVLIDDLAVYDRISTEKDHRRKGIATFLMKELERIALSKGIFHNFLVATEEGKMLYESLGWVLYSSYTSIVISS